GKSDSIRRITPETLVDVLDGRFSALTDFRVIDVRFPFEYDGGHIAGAINVNSFEDLDAMFFTGGDHVPRAMHTTAIIFHCEFSSHRAPAMAMHLRAQDRIVNMAKYPAVYYPEIYVLEGGYKRFWSELPSRCTPHGAYIPMDHEEFRDVCKHE
ncbi:Rhodanese-like domain-containing protein, partial [Catenaria anguillulae PL171]